MAKKTPRKKAKPGRKKRGRKKANPCAKVEGFTQRHPDEVTTASP